MDTLKVLAFICMFYFANGESCASKFKNGTESFLKVLNDCAASLKIEPAKLAEIMASQDKEDMCLSKCYMEKFDIVKSNKVDIDAFNAFLEDQAPTALVTKLSETVTKCAASTGTEKLAKEKLQPADICKIIHSFHTCFVQSADKLC